MQFIDKLGWIEIKDRKVLSARSKGTDVYYIPGGKREEGESDQQALCREIREELTVELLQATLESICQFEAQAHGRPEGVIVRMRCYTGQYEGTISASSEIEEVSWLSHADKHKGSLLFEIILDWLKVQDLID